MRHGSDQEIIDEPGEPASSDVPSKTGVDTQLAAPETDANYTNRPNRGLNTEAPIYSLGTREKIKLFRGEAAGTAAGTSGAGAAAGSSC